MPKSEQQPGETEAEYLRRMRREASSQALASLLEQDEYREDQERMGEASKDVEEAEEAEADAYFDDQYEMSEADKLKEGEAEQYAYGRDQAVLAGERQGIPKELREQWEYGQDQAELGTPSAGFTAHGGEGDRAVDRYQRRLAADRKEQARPGYMAIRRRGGHLRPLPETQRIREATARDIHPASYQRDFVRRVQDPSIEPPRHGTYEGAHPESEEAVRDWKLNYRNDDPSTWSLDNPYGEKK